MTIGTAKPSRSELDMAQHYFIDHRSITDRYSAGTYEREAIALIGQLHASHDVIIAAGGTGLYLNALSDGLDVFPDVDPDIKDRLNTEHKTDGLIPLIEELKKSDPMYAASIDLSNPHRRSGDDRLRLGR